MSQNYHISLFPSFLDKKRRSADTTNGAKSTSATYDRYMPQIHTCTSTCERICGRVCVCVCVCVVYIALVNESNWIVYTVMGDRIRDKGERSGSFFGSIVSAATKQRRTTVSSFAAAKTSSSSSFSCKDVAPCSFCDAPRDGYSRKCETCGRPHCRSCKKMYVRMLWTRLPHPESKRPTPPSLRPRNLFAHSSRVRFPKKILATHPHIDT